MDESDDTNKDVKDLVREGHFLAMAMRRLKTTVSPQLAGSIQATENAIREMEREFGLHSGGQVAERLGVSSNDIALMRRSGKLLGFRRGRGYVYPGFQFDGSTVREAIPPLLEVTQRAGWPSLSLAFWLCSGSGYLDDARPVDRLDDVDAVVYAADNHMNIEW